MAVNKLSIIIPVYNERGTVLELIKRVESVNLPLVKEIIIVDDGSTDGTKELLEQLDKNKFILIFKERNEGKGSALKSGFDVASGDVIITQDADLECDPRDYEKVLEPILDGRADVVYGSRFVGSGVHRWPYFRHYIGNRFLTFLSNTLTNLNLSDMETGCKAFRKEVIDSFKHKLRSKKFDIEPEITARIAKGKWRVYEAGISYSGRTYKEGKKVTWRDGIKAAVQIIRFNFLK